MQIAGAILPNHLAGIYKEMRGEIEAQIFNIDFKGLMKQALEDVSLIEFNETIVGVAPYKRNGQRLNYRNGFYKRSLDTVFGWIEGIKIPRPRYGGFVPRCIGGKYNRRQESLNRVVTECFWRGISTRDVKKITEALCGVSLSAQTVSRLTTKWDDEVKRWHQRKLSDDYVYLMFDGIWIKNRTLSKKKRLILVAYGIKCDGKREIIDYGFAGSESAENWIKFLTNLHYRGLEGAKLELIVTDGCRGLINAVDTVFPAVSHQLCWAHKMRNILKSVKISDKKKVKAGLDPIFKEELKEKQASTLLQRWAKKWRPVYPKAVHCLEKDIDNLLLYFSCDPKHHKAIRTSNHIERQFKEYRRRMRPMEIIPNKQSADRILYAITMRRNEKLEEYPLFNFTQNMLH